MGEKLLNGAFLIVKGSSLNYEYVITKEGYRREDLTEENQNVLWWIDYALEGIDNFTSLKAPYLDNPEGVSLYKQVLWSYTEEALEELKDYMRGYVADIQISLAESENRED